MFIIKAVNSDGILYMGIDGESGGYPYFSTSLKSATMFKDMSDAEKYLTREVNADPVKMTDGKVYPNTFLHTASKTNVYKMQDTVVFTVSEVKVVDTNIRYEKLVQLPV